MSKHSELKAKCRGCGRALRGRAYCFGERAYHPDTGEQAKVNYYGGFVCSPECDYRASLDHEQSMPGHGSGQIRLGDDAQRTYDRNWGDK